MAGFGCQVAVAFEPTGLAQHPTVQIDPVHGLWEHMRATRRHVGVTVSHGRCTGLYLVRRSPCKQLEAVVPACQRRGKAEVLRSPLQLLDQRRRVCVSELSLSPVVC